MKTANAAMIALLTPTRIAQTFVQADLYMLTLVNGQTYYYTSGDRDLELSGHNFLSTGPTFKRGKTRHTIGVQVDNLDVTIGSKATDLLGTVPWLHAVAAGALSGARMLVERFISNSWSNLAPGKIYQFEGRVSNPELVNGQIRIEVVSDLILLAQKLPRNIYQATCMHTLYDAGCALSKAAFTTTSGVVASGSDRSVIFSNLGQSNDYFNLGVITFTSGPNNGVQRTIRSYLNSAGRVTPVVPFPEIPAVGNTFSIYPGCNKLREGDCLTKFSNQPNFKGTPYVPTAETAS